MVCIYEYNHVLWLNLNIEIENFNQKKNAMVSEARQCNHVNFVILYEEIKQFYNEMLYHGLSLSKTLLNIICTEWGKKNLTMFKMHYVGKP
jgi:hypothetical protein